VSQEDQLIPEVVASETIYEGRIVSLVRDTIRLAGGKVATREVIRHPGAVAMVPIDPEGRLLLVTQYRHAAGKTLLEIPAGTLEPGEKPESTAIRELQEEIGMHPGRIEPIGGFFVAPGYTSEYIHLYICSALTESKLSGDDDEDITVVALSRAEALEAIALGRIADAKSVAGILRWAHR
jgi:ADP-ribose pyrophosphatase